MRLFSPTNSPASVVLLTVTEITPNTGASSFLFLNYQGTFNRSISDAPVNSFGYKKAAPFHSGKWRLGFLSPGLVYSALIGVGARTGKVVGSSTSIGWSGESGSIFGWSPASGFYRYNRVGCSCTLKSPYLIRAHVSIVEKLLECFLNVHLNFSTLLWHFLDISLYFVLFPPLHYRQKGIASLPLS